LSIRFELVSGRGEEFWPRPGRMFAGACSHSFSELLTRSIARSLVEIAHLYRFVFADGRRIGQPEFDDIEQGFIHGVATKLGTLTLGEQFVYEFDFGDSWTHLCWRRRGSTSRQNWESFRAVRCPHWGWKRSPTNTGATGQTTTKNTTSHPTRAATSHLQPMMGPTTTGLSGRVAGSRAQFVRVWCEVVDTGVSTARVVPGFDPLEDRL
jgi:hypothetical protein